MSKFFVKSNQINGSKIIINGEDVNHIINVLRLKENDEIQICNGDTSENYNTKIISNDNENVICEIIEKIDKVSVEDIKKYAKEILFENEFVVAASGKDIKTSDLKVYETCLKQKKEDEKQVDEIVEIKTQNNENIN